MIATRLLDDVFPNLLKGDFPGDGHKVLTVRMPFNVLKVLAKELDLG